MNVILLEDFNTYKVCDVLKFSKGFCLNFLIPKFFVFSLSKKINKNLDKFKKIIFINDLKKKKFFKKLYIKYNNKKIYVNNFNYNFSKNFFFKKFLLKKLGFIYYNYCIFFFKKIKENIYMINVKIYNNIFVKFFIYLIND